MYIEWVTYGTKVSNANFEKQKVGNLTYATDKNIHVVVVCNVFDDNVYVLRILAQVCQAKVSPYCVLRFYHVPLCIINYIFAKYKL